MIDRTLKWNCVQFLDEINFHTNVKLSPKVDAGHVIEKDSN